MNDDETMRDPELGAALRALRADAPEPDWGALRARLAVEAELPLARRRRARSVSRALRTVLPLAAAAGIAALALTALPARDDGRLRQADEAMVEEILDLSVPEQVGALLTGEAADRALLDAVDDGTPE
jgi:hypothetical protein